MKLVVLALAVMMSACTPVAPWERGLLSHPCMRASSRPEEGRATAHMLGAREGSVGATGERGGGCGCK